MRRSRCLRNSWLSHRFSPIDKEPLLLYVAANSRAVSVAVVVERKETGNKYPVQRPAYYVSEVLINSK